jgi:hypothetical protein
MAGAGGGLDRSVVIERPGIPGMKLRWRALLRVERLGENSEAWAKATSSPGRVVSLTMCSECGCVTSTFGIGVQKICNEVVKFFIDFLALAEIVHGVGENARFFDGVECMS